MVGYKPSGMERRLSTGYTACGSLPEDVDVIQSQSAENVYGSTGGSMGTELTRCNMRCFLVMDAHSAYS